MVSCLLPVLRGHTMKSPLLKDFTFGFVVVVFAHLKSRKYRLNPKTIYANLSKREPKIDKTGLLEETSRTFFFAEGVFPDSEVKKNTSTVRRPKLFPQGL